MRIWVLKQRNLKVFPVRITKYSPLETKPPVVERFIDKNEVDVLEAQPIRSSGDMELYVGFGRGHFHELILGSILYSSPDATISSRYRFMPYQSPIILPSIIDWKNSNILPIEAVLPPITYSDVAYVFIAIKLKNVFSTKLFEGFKEFYQDLRRGRYNSNTVMNLDPKFFVKVMIQDYGLPYMIAPRSQGPISPGNYRDNSWKLSFVKLRRLWCHVGLITSSLKVSFRIFNLLSINSFIRKYYNNVHQTGFKNYPSITNTINKIFTHRFLGNVSLRSRNFDWLDLLPYVLLFGTLELGIHGLAHALAKILPFIFRFMGSSFGEIILLEMPSPKQIEPMDPLSTDFFSTMTHELARKLSDNVVDGFIYRKITQDSDAYAMAIVYSKIDHSGEQLERQIRPQTTNLYGRVYNEILSVIYRGTKDRCYENWSSLLKPLRNKTLHYIQHALPQDQMTSCNDSVRNLFNLIKNHFAQILSAAPSEFYIPLDFLRRYIYKDLSKNLAIRLNNQSWLNCQKDIHKILKQYSSLIYEHTIPNCFDGCYNCILWKQCYYPSPLLRPWIISKFATKKLLLYP